MKLLPLFALLLGAAPEPYEGDEPGECTDRADNDRDLTFDCLDAGCAGSPDCVRGLVLHGVTPGTPLTVGTDVKVTAELLIGSTVVPNPQVQWSSSTPSVITVGVDGTVHPVAAGNATLTARAEGVTKSVDLTVQRPSGVLGAMPDDEAMRMVQDGTMPEGLVGTKPTPAEPPQPGDIGTIGGDSIIIGALDKSLIDAVIKRNMNQIRYCYQRELTGNPALAGRITVKFVIAKDGTVSTATTKTSTMNNPAVESCINGRFMRFQFPEPKGGGIVIVSYPFVFEPA